MRLFDGSQNKGCIAQLAAGVSAGESLSEQRVLVGNSVATIEAFPSNGPSTLTPKEICTMSLALPGLQTCANDRLCL